MGRRNITHDCTMPTLEFYKVVIQQNEDIIRMKEITLIINDTDTICITVRCDTDIISLLHYKVLQSM